MSAYKNFRDLPEDVLQHTLKVFRDCNYNQSEAARVLGIGRTTLQNRLYRAEQHKIQLPAKMELSQKDLIEVSEEEEKPIDLLRMRKILRTNKILLNDLAAQLGAKPERVQEALHELRAQNFSVHQHGDMYWLSTSPVAATDRGLRHEYRSRPDGSFVFGFTSDNHLCFPASTRVETKKGPKRISQIKVGDLVLTHKNRYRKVKEVIRTAKYEGPMTKIRFKGICHGGSDDFNGVTCTPNHPFLVVRDGVEGWLPAKDIRPGDAVRRLSHSCKHCNTKIPEGWQVCKEHDNFARKDYSAKRAQRRAQSEKTEGSRHWREDILPQLEKWEAAGFRVIPVDRVRPDFIAIKDGRVIAVEVESPQSGSPKPCYEKYAWVDHEKYYDKIHWIEIDKRVKKANRKYDWLEANEDGFAASVVTSVVEVEYSKSQAVYNLIVEEDETYVAKRCVVHNCSKYSRLDVLHKLYERFAEVGVDRVFNAGNWIDGEASFNKHDLVVHGMDAQCRYLANNWPKHEGIVTYAVTGDDHEGWYAQREGVDIGLYAERIFQDAGREDWVDLGYMEADIALIHAETGARNRLRVAHPGGGSAYATSYAPQKYIESLDGGDKPAVVLLGHWHKMELLNIRNVWSIQTGCTQDQTPFGRKKRLDFQVGGGICRIQMDPDTGAIFSCTVELIRFFNKAYYGTGRWSHHGDVTMPERAR